MSKLPKTLAEALSAVRGRSFTPQEADRMARHLDTLPVTTARDRDDLQHARLALAAARTRPAEPKGA